MDRASKMVEEEEELQLQEQEAPIYGDILESILSHVPLIDLVPVSRVSISWNRAVFPSLIFNPLKPWLVVHTQSTRSPYKTTTHAYDPRSHVWMEVSQPSIKYVSALRSSHSNFLYMLSPSKLAFSFDPLNLTWHHVGPPLVWRTDPIVAIVGDKIIVAGGTCDFEDDPLAVEIYDVVANSWDTCESMPFVLRDSAASTWLSVAADNQRLFVTEKYSGTTHVFNPNSKTWYGPYDLRPDHLISYSIIGFSAGHLILIGLIGDVERVERVKVWEVNSDNFGCEEITEMPSPLVEKLKRENFHVSSINVCMAGNFLYIYNASEVEEVFVCEFEERESGCRWGCVGNVVGNERNCMERMVFTCSEVGIDDLQRAMRSENRRFVVKGKRD
ncbi:unnamed protein product [Ilex paraguariensis]|uniref:F-box domain-containing protein n=1 Tax=Ilex paraguariensis TaxID=185542 RepID=A0ABC8UPP2_9AQUA